MEVLIRRALGQIANFLEQPLLFLEHVAMAHRLVLARIGFDLGAVDRDRAELDQAHLSRDVHHLNEQTLEILQVLETKLRDGPMRREVVRTEDPVGHVFLELTSDLS